MGGQFVNRNRSRRTKLILYKTFILPMLLCGSKAWTLLSTDAAAFSAIERETTKMDLAVNEGKTKHMLSTSRDVRHIDSQFTGNNYTFDTVKEFIYLGSAVTTKNDVSLEIKSSYTLANRCCYGLNGQLSNRDLSRTTKPILYKTLILQALLYGAEAWILLSTDVAVLRVFDRKVLRKIFGPVRVCDDFRIRFNSELYELLNDMAIVQCINFQRLRWLDHVVRMEKDALARRVFDAGISGSRRRGRPCIRWEDQIEEALSSIGVTNWRRRAKSRSAWKDVLR